MLRIVTDGAADLVPGWREEYDVQVIPVNIHFGEKTYLQNVDLDLAGFYRLVDESRKVPKTSQPTPHQFVEFYRQIAQRGDTILSIHVTSKLSGTLDSSIAAGRELVGEFRVIPFDSTCGSVGIGMLCREARRLERTGLGVDAIVTKLEEVRTQIGTVLALDTLEYARMSGRVGTLQAALASVLNVKPIAVLRDGRIEMAEKVRTRRASLDRLIEMVQERVGREPIEVSIVHARDPQSGLDLQARVQAMFNIKEITMTDLSISIAANLGPGTVGIIYRKLS